MKHLLFILISLLLLSSPVIGQSEKPQTIIIPTGSIGEMSESRIITLEKRLESKLDDHFAIVPKELFEEAQDQAFQEIDSDQCTEDQCIRMIQEFLQVENSFKMDLITENEDTQISITWNNQDQKRVEEDYCESCNTNQLRLMIGGLVEKLVRNQVIEKKSDVVEKKEPVTENIGDNVEDKKEDYTKKLRVFTGTVTATVDQGYTQSEFFLRSNSLYYSMERWGFGITDLSASTTYSNLRLKNRSLDLTYDFNYKLLNHLNLTIGIGYILEGEASKSYTTTEVSGFRYISFLRKSFGKWALMLGYQVNSYSYNYNSPFAWESNIQTQLDTLSKQNIFMIGSEIGF